MVCVYYRSPYFRTLSSPSRCMIALLLMPQEVVGLFVLVDIPFDTTETPAKGVMWESSEKVEI